VGDDPGHGNADPDQAPALGVELSLEFFDSEDDLLDHNLGIMVLGVQAHVRHSRDPHPQVETLNADAGLPHLYADYPSEVGVNLQQDPRAAAVRLF